MGYGAEQVGPHPDLFIFHSKLVQLAGLGGQSGGDDRNTEKGQEGQGVAGDGQVEGPIGKGEEKVDGDDAQHRREKTPEIAGGQAGGQQHSQHKNRRGEASAGVQPLQ